MKIYNVIIEDRHTDTEAYPFSSDTEAITWAKQYVEPYRNDEDFEEDATGDDFDEWLYYCKYSCEGDSVHVVEYTLNHPEK